ncbi:MAG TPA: carboxylate--amine ligase [Candidatus Dormibacteraeota bacterium]|nr:carboxylate--amine ligase [Candidatus Dormibacteraeota bacterium]
MIDARLTSPLVDAGTPVAVFKLTSDPFQHGTLAIARSLGRLGVRVHLATRDPDAPPARSRYVASRTGMPPPEAGDVAILELLRRVAARIGTRALLIAADDVAALFVADNFAQLPREFLLPDQPAGLPLELSDKGRLHNLCLRAGIPTPAARFPTSRDEMLAGAEELGYPIVLKSMDPRILRRRPRAVSVAVAHTRNEAIELYDRIEDPGEPNLMLQEFIPGDARSIWMFNGYFDRNGASPIGIVGQKIRQAPPRTGATTLGVVVSNEVVRELAVRFLGDLGYRGMVDLGFRYDARDGRYKLLDVNPRIGSSFRLFVARNGLDVVRALYLDLTGQSVPGGRAPEGRRWLVEDQDLATSIKLAWRGELGLRGYLSSLRGVEERAWVARDDPRPAARMVVQTIRTLAARAVGRLRQPDPAGDGEGSAAAPS